MRIDLINLSSISRVGIILKQNLHILEKKLWREGVGLS